MANEQMSFDEFHAWRESYYGMAKIIDEAEVYIRIDGDETKK